MNCLTVLFRVHVQNPPVFQNIHAPYRKIVDRNFHGAFVADKMMHCMNVEPHEHYVVWLLIGVVVHMTVKNAK